MDWNSILQFILKLIGQSKVDNSAPNQTPNVNTISIQRGPLEPTIGIFGDGSLTWSAFTFVSLENEKLFIPTGTYKLEWHESPHLGNATVPMLVGVEGRTEILMHWGNDEACSEGCILCGAVRDGNDIDTTQTACKELFAKINAVGIENCQIEIR
jgi:Family of unknown function (DUF5675)